MPENNQFKSLLDLPESENAPSLSPAEASAESLPPASRPASLQLPPQLVSPMAVPQPAIPDEPEGLRSFGDTVATRRAIFDRVLEEAGRIVPAETATHSLRFENPRWVGPESFSIQDQKKALLSRGTLARRLTATAKLYDAAGNLLSERDTQLARVPYMTDRGTFILNGSERTLASQMRLRPGVFTRRKSNGETEAHVNPKKGYGHRLFLDPETGIFRIQMGQARIPLVPLLKAMGVSDSKLREAWGNELASVNAQKSDPQAIRKLYQKLHRKGELQDAESQSEAVAKSFREMTLDPEVTQRTLGQPFTNVNEDALLATTARLLAVSRGDEPPDDRDALPYQTLLGPEDLFAERVAKAGPSLRRLLWKASPVGNLDKLQPNALHDAINSVLTSSGLGLVPEEINLADIFDQQSRVTRMGEGGIGSLTAVPDESRSVQPTQMGFVDPLRTPESGRVGVDLRLAGGARKGKDGRLYTQVRNREGQVVWKSPQDLADTVLAFPEEMNSREPFVTALSGGRMRVVPRESVDYEVPRMESAFSPLGNMVPMKSSVKGQRAVMAARMLTQALPLVGAEAPWVQAGMPDNPERSYEQEYADRMGALRADSGGRVVSVTPEAIQVQYEDGTKKTHDLYQNFPFNRKSSLHQTPVVEPGQQFTPGQLLAKSNFTDDEGTTALGMNARVAYVPWGGLNYEDATVVSKGFAERMRSNHLYQHRSDWEANNLKGLRSFISAFPAKYDRKTLANFDDTGVVRVGTTVQPGDPLVLAVREKEKNQKSLLRGGRSFSDVSETWEHETPGIVTDVVDDGKGATVVVKTEMPLQVGDKLCFDPETELLTRRSWKRVADITWEDELATLNPATDELEWRTPDALHDYEHVGDMYQLQTKHVDMLVTPEHDLWVARPGQAYRKVTAKDFYNAKGEWQFKKDCNWAGREQNIFTPPAYTSHNSRDNELPVAVSMATWLEFLGYYIAEGRKCRTTSGGWQVQISQFVTSPHWQAIADCLTALPVRWAYNDDANRFEINSKHLWHAVDDCGDSAYTKRVPGYVQALAPRQLRIFFFAYMDGDGHRGASWEYGTSSAQLSFDLEVVLLKIGWCGSSRLLERDDNFQKNPHWRTRVNRKHLRPWWKKHRAKCYDSVTEGMVPYSGRVYCVTAANHLVYAKRGGKSYWSGNSGRYG